MTVRTMAEGLTERRGVEWKRNSSRHGGQKEEIQGRVRETDPSRL